jgi:membrane protease subunit (stomatin/prohibitin family)
MLRRRIGRRGRPGLIGTMARTAVVAGTATAVVGGVSRRQQARAQQAQTSQLEEQQIADMQAQLDQVQAAEPAESGPVAQIEHLGEMRTKGLLTEEEFAAAKARVLGI